MLRTFRHGGSLRNRIRRTVPRNIRQDARNIYSGSLAQRGAGLVGMAGTAARLPEWGISESQGQAQVYGDYDGLAPNTVSSMEADIDGYDPYSGHDGGGGDGYTAEDIAYLQNIKNNYLDQRGRLDTTLSQGNTRITDEYGREVNRAETGKTNQLNAYGGQRQDQTGIKGQNYSQINSAANRGYNSLAGMLGRASGTGSSAYQQMLPNVVGKDVYGKRSQANDMFGRNMQNIDGSETSYLANFALVLDDLERQKDQNESDLLSGVEEQRQNIASRLGTVEGQLAAAAGGGAAQIRAAQAPYDAEVRSSRDAVDGLFNKYFRAFTPQTADAPAPELGTYTMDRSQINAGQQGVADPTNPYADLIRRKRQQEQGL